MIRSFVCSVYLLTVCFAYPIQANDECLINHGLMDEIPSLNNQTTINAGSIQVLSDATLELRNGFEIKLEDLHVNGDQAVFNENKKSINEILNGFISGQNYVSKFEKGSINSLADEAILESGEVLFRNRNIKFEFKELKESTQDKFKIINTSFTSCADTQKGWEVTADEVQLNDESGRGILKNLKVKLFNTTVFGFPVIPFTATDKRTSGFLEPEIAFSSDGWDAYLPIYIVTSEKTDLTFAPRTINDRGNGFELNLRNLSGFNQNNIDVIKINNDKQISKASNKDRWAYAIDHKYDLGKLNMQIEWSKTSDPLVLNDIETNFNKSIDRRAHFLPQKVVVGFPLVGGKFKIHKESYQIINPLFPYELNKSPAANFSIEKIFGATSYSLNLDSSKFSIDKVPLKFYSALTNANGLLDKFDTGKRNLATAKMKTVLNNRSYIAEIENELIYKDYDQDSGKNYDGSFIKSKITFRKYFSKRDNLKQSNFELLSGFGYTNYRDQSSLPVFDSQFLFGSSYALFSNSRFLGLDRIIDEKYLFIGFKHLLDTQNYRIRTNFGLKERLEPSKVLNKIYGSDSERDIATFNSSFHTNNNLSFDVGATYDQDNSRLERSELALGFANEKSKLLLAKKFLRGNSTLNLQNLNYYEFGFEREFISSWKVISGFKRDQGMKKNIDAFLGLGYESCCLGLRVYVSDKRLIDTNTLFDVSQLNENEIYAWKEMISLENKSRITFEFELKGLSSKKNKLTRFFQKSILNL